jgi:tetratricopeptide (TPR) repeat protein
VTGLPDGPIDHPTFKLCPQINLGLIHYQQGDLDPAEAAFTQALSVLQDLGDLVHAAAALNNLGLIHRVRGELEAAEACFRESLAAAREAGDREGEGHALNNLGLIYKAWGQLDEALACYQADAAICGEINDTYGLAAALLNCALIHADQENWEAVRRDGGRAWRLALVEGYDDLRARLSVLWGRDALAQGDNEAAAGHWHEALETASQVNDMERLRVKAELERLSPKTGLKG